MAYIKDKELKAFEELIAITSGTAPKDVIERCVNAVVRLREADDKLRKTALVKMQQYRSTPEGREKSREASRKSAKKRKEKEREEHDGSNN